MASSVLSRELTQQLRRIVGRAAVLTEAGELLPYESDALTAHRATPAAVAFVHDTEQLVRVVSALHAARFPFVPRGSGTGLSGGALADGAVVIEMSRMNRVLWIDRENLRARVQPGVTNTELNEAVAARGLIYAPDPSSGTACTLGGNVAENSGGPHCLKYGVTTNHVLHLTIVTPEGTLIDLPGRDGPGYDLVGLLVGSEGTLGICAEIEVRLLPRPAAVETLLAHFDDIDDATRAVSAIIAAGIVPAALEMIDRETLKAVEASVYAAGFPTDVAASLIVELDGPAAGLAEEAGEVEAILSAHRARHLERAEDDADRLRFWRARKSAFGALGRLGSDLLVQDATVPRSRLPKVLARILQVARKYDLEIANVFHAGDGNLHPNIPFDARDAELTERVHAASREIVEACIAEGGTITGEHGVGIDKQAYMPLIFSETDRRAMRWVKQVFDPDGLCNPGKILPDEAEAAGGGAWPADERGRAVARAHGGASDGIAAAIESRFGLGCLADDAKAFVLDGEPVSVVAAPRSVEELSEIMKLAASEGWAVVPAGEGGWLSAGYRLSRADLVVSTRRLSGDVEHHPEDLLASVPAGTTLAQLAPKLAGANQWWALDPLGGGSVGATIATASAGPLAATYGTPRDLVLGLQLVLADGSVVEAGGRVVKNVAGYDMVKLFTGSWGTLGVIVQAHLRLHALPADDRTRLFFAQSGSELAALAAELCRPGAIAPAAVEILSPDAAGALGLGDGSWLLAARWFGHESTVEAAVSAAIATASSHGLLRTEVQDALWDRFASLEADLRPALSLRVQVPIAATYSMIGLAAPFAGGRAPPVVASPLSGRVWVFVPRSWYDKPADDRVWLLRVNDFRRAAEGRGGTLRIERSPETLRGLADPWGDAGASLRFHRGLKQRFDPRGILKPGFFVGRV